MAAFSAALLVGSLAVSAIGQIKSGNAAKRAGEKQREVSESEARLAEFNASVADVQAADATQRGAETESRFRQGVRAHLGQQRASFGASGVDVGFGSALDVQADTIDLGEQDALQIRTNAAREAWGYKVQGADLRERARIARKEGVYLEAAGREAQTASRFAAASTIAGGAAQGWESYNRRAR